MAKNRFVSGIQLLPKPVAQDDFLIAPDFTFFFRKRPPQQRRDTQQMEPRRRHQHPANLLRRTVQLHGLIVRLEEGLALKSRHFLEPVEIVAGGGVVAARNSGVGVIVRHEENGVRVRHRQRPQNDRVHDSKKGGVGCHANGKCKKHGQRKASVAPQRTNAVFQVTKKCTHDLSSPRLPPVPLLWVVPILARDSGTTLSPTSGQAGARQSIRTAPPVFRRSSRAPG